MSINNTTEDLTKIILGENNTTFEEKLDNVVFKDFQERLENSNEATLEEAAYDYQNKGMHGAFDYIYEHYKPILDRLGYRKNDDDLSQELSEVLWNAVQKFDSRAGVKFNTFFWTCAQNHMGTQKIRKNAQKRSGAKKVEITSINPETGLEETTTEIIKVKVVSLQATINSSDSETEMGSFIENKASKAQYDESELEICLKQLCKAGLIKTKEMKAIQMICDGATLAEIGNELNGVTAPAIHVMLRRLGEKKQIRKQLMDILSV